MNQAFSEGRNSTRGRSGQYPLDREFGYFPLNDVIDELGLNEIYEQWTRYQALNNPDIPFRQFANVSRDIDQRLEGGYHGRLFDNRLAFLKEYNEAMGLDPAIFE